MKKFSLICIVVAAMIATPVSAEESTTDIGIYLFAAAIDGEVQVRNVTADVDVSFSDIMDNLDIGFMGYFELRRGQWSFIGDFAYLALEDDNSTTVGMRTEIDLDAELTQTVASALAGYRFLDKSYDGYTVGFDIVFGARYTNLEVDLSVERRRDGVLLDFSSSGSRNHEEDWIDAVIGLRIESDYQNGWGSMLWLDIGEGSDSNSYQALAMVNYSVSDWRFHGGYRILNLEYDNGSDSDTFAVDLDYTGPMLGASYRF